MAKRQSGHTQPGIQWGPFTLRIPFIHTGFALPEFLQGFFVAAATGLALVPILTSQFDLLFAEAVAMVMLHSFLISSAWMFFGEPYCPGWVTPALPFVLLFVVGSGDFATAPERFQAMTALSLDFAAIMIILGATGLGAKLMRWMPEVLKGGIILGAAIAAFISVLDLSQGDKVLSTQPIATTVAIVISLILAFSAPLQKLQGQYPLLQKITSLGLLPGFLLAALIGPLVGEFEYNIEWGILLPPVADLWVKVAPWSIGWPDFGLYIQCLPLAFMTYIILFGDLITAEEILKDGISARPDEKITPNNTRTHISIGIRNALMAIFAPFFPTQGALWTGVQVIVVQRWKQGREKLDSLFDGISSYYFFNIPLLFFCLPLLTGLKPLMGIALALTLVLTGFACAYVALAKANTPQQQGAMVLTAVCLALFEPWQGLLVGLAAAYLLVGREPDVDSDAETDAKVIATADQKQPEPGQDQNSSLLSQSE